jgi:N-acetylglucosaminyldiphosphoundecaprenol N-acetyl-beta-D-mannosaminyltransferase
MNLMMEIIPEIEVLGSRVPVLTLKQGIEVTEQMILQYSGSCSQIINTGFHGIWIGSQDHTFCNILNSAEFWVPDGISYAIIARAHGHKMRRIGGPEYVKALLELSVEQGYRHFFFGDTPETLEALDTKLDKNFPGIKIAGMFSPPFRETTPQEDLEQVKMINDARPDVLWVGLGCPKQERWIAEHKDRLKVPVAVGIGAIFRFLAGTVSQAPAFVGRIGLEWAWRLAAEPRKCWRRCVIDGPQFLFHVGVELAGRKRSLNHEN